MIANKQLLINVSKKLEKKIKIEKLFCERESLSLYHARKKNEKFFLKIKKNNIKYPSKFNSTNGEAPFFHK